MLKPRRGRPKVSKLASLNRELDRRLAQAERLKVSGSPRVLRLDLTIAHRIDWLQAQIDKRRPKP